MPAHNADARPNTPDTQAPEQDQLPTPVADPETYALVFDRYRTFLYKVVAKTGVPASEVPDSTMEIWARMMSKDGLAAYDGNLATDPEDKIRVYLGCYFRAGAKAERSRIFTRNTRQTSLDAIHERQEAKALYNVGTYEFSIDAEMIEDVYPSLTEPDTEADLIDRLVEQVDTDGATFIERADAATTYPRARQTLVDDGWDTSRIRRTVKRTRATVSTYLRTAA